MNASALESTYWRKSDGAGIEVGGNSLRLLFKQYAAYYVINWLSFQDVGVHVQVCEEFALMSELTFIR